MLRAAASEIYGSCTTGDERHIAAALRPSGRDKVRPIVEVAARFRIPLYPISTGHNWGYGCALPARDGCVLLDLSRLTEISNFDPALGIVTVEPGVTQGMLARFLDDQGAAFLVPVTGAGPNASIVGNALERGYGITPISDHFLAVQSLEAVLPDGRLYMPVITELGGQLADRTFKWGMGPYLDGLFAQGGFGVVTCMTIALAARPQSVKAFFFGIVGDEALGPAVDAVRHVVQRLPGLVGGVNIMNRRRVLAMATTSPTEARNSNAVLSDAAVAALAHKLRIAPWTIFGTLYGTDRTVRAAQTEVRQIVRPLARGLRFVSRAGTMRLLRFAKRLPGASGTALARRAAILDSSLDLVAGRPNETALRLPYWKSGRIGAAGQPIDPSRDGCGLLWYAPLVVMRPEVVTRYVAFVTEIMTRHRLDPLITLTTLSERCFDSSVPLLFDRDDTEAVARANNCYHELLDEGVREGFVPYRIGIGAMDWLERQGTIAWDVVSDIKRALDPLGILSPGRYAPFGARR
jgi:4-cresol dehydrogenase (hydroxylating) flavoprotein subunit